MAMSRIMPTMQVEPVKGKFERIKYEIEEGVRKIVTPSGQEKTLVTRKLVKHNETFEDGYMVYFPAGHSIFVAADDTEQLERLGIHKPAKLVDLESGEEVPDDAIALTPKQIVAAKTHDRRMARADVGAN